jgi:Contractile injection system tape measure protein
VRASPHRIRALRWQVRTGSQEEALVLRRWLRDGLDSDLLPAMTEAFDAADPTERVLHIPRIELRLEIANTDRFLERLAEFLRRRLGELLDAAGTVPMEERLSPVRHLAGDEVRFEALVHYLETGGLPWAAAGRDRAETVEELRWTASRELARLLESRRADPEQAEGMGGTVAFYFRLLQLLPEEEWPSVAKEVVARHPGGLGNALEKAFAEVTLPQRGSRFVRLQQAAVFLAVVRMGPDESAEERREFFEAAGNWIGQLPKEAAAVFRRWRADGGGAVVPQRAEPMEERPGSAEKEIEGELEKLSDPGVRGLRPSPPAPLPSALPDPRERGEERALASKPSAGSAGFQPATGAETDGGNAARRRTPLSRRSGREAGRGAGRGAGGEGRRPLILPQETYKSHSLPSAFPLDLPVLPTPEPGDLPLAVSHTGLILLHPFFPRFFESLGVLEARAVHLPDGVLPRAAALLHRLATGEEEAFELELGFVKILLGLAPEDPLPVASGLLDQADLDEVDALLQAVIGHWSVLKNTSIAGLRQTFLQRRGLVREREEGFQLQVEPESFDVLLGHLPWGIATVKLPWMSKAIHTDWPTP